MNHRTKNYVVTSTALYGLLIVHVSLFPLSGWHDGNAFGWLTGSLPHHVSRKDALVNLLAYIPFGFLVCHCRLSRGDRRAAAVSSLLAGFCLSFAMESLQNFLPAREPSLVDLLTNSGGALIGGALALWFTTAVAPGGALRRWQEQWLASGCGNSIGAAVLLLWALARLSPFVPSLRRPGQLIASSQLWLTLHGKLLWQPVDALVHCCFALGLALLTVLILRPTVRPLRLFAAVAAIVLPARIFIFNGNLTLEEVAGYSVGIGLAVLLGRLPGRLPVITAIVALLTGFVLYELKAGTATTPFGPMNWIPFRYYLDNALGGIGQILEWLWPFSALALLCMKLNWTGRAGGVMYGGAALFLLVLLLEWQQQFIPGRTADVTQAMLALVGWCWPFFLSHHKSEKV